MTAGTKLVEARAAAGPDWVAALRREAWERHVSLPFPKGREEYWRYTDLSVLRLDGYADAPDAPGVTRVPERAKQALELSSGTSSAGRAVHADGGVLSIELGDEAASQGVIWTDLETAAEEHADLLTGRLGSLVGADDHFTSWALAMHRGGTFLYVPRGVTIQAPFQALHWLSAAGTSVWPRTVVVVEPEANIVFNDLYLSDALEAPTLAGPVTELFCGRGSHVGWVTWQDWGTGVRHLAHMKAKLERDAKLNTLVVTLGGDFSRTWKECLLAGEGAESIMLGLYFAHRDQRFEHWTVQDHLVPNTRSDLLYKGSLDDHAKTVYYGTIFVRPGARYTDAYQANRNLNLSRTAQAFTNPQLRIENSLVRCTHGATVGRISDEHLFYLMSRGISRHEAERLVVFGFFNEVLGRVEWSGMHERLAEAIHEKLESKA